MRTSNSKHFVIAVILVAMLAPMVAGCAQGKAQAQVRQSDAGRDSNPDVALAELDALTSGNSAFAFDLYQSLRNRNGNLFFSPYSISVALAMTCAGARGETERQMAETLHFTLPQGRLHPAFNALDLRLRNPDEDDFKLHIANSLWGQTGYAFLDQFLDVLAQNYGAGLRLLDFANQPEVSRLVINNWVSDQTEERIQDLIPQGAISPLTRLVLANAIYFDADWMHPFAKELTRDGTFNTLDGTQVAVPMMALPEPQILSYAQADGYQVVELPYKGGEIAMTILVPDSGQFETFEAALDAERVEKILGDLESGPVTLTMPKFSYESEFSLAQKLIEMGMPNAFGSDADFSGMDGTQELFISDVFHKAFVAVDEAGTEAAAATAVVMRAKAAPVPALQITVDRPFIYMLHGVETGTILFAGRVVNPAVRS